VVVPLCPSSEHILIVRAPGAVEHTGFPIYLHPSLGAAWLSPPLRASREHRFTLRPLRAQGVHQATPLSPLTALSPGSYNLFTFLPVTV
jgi:hypothetical protein